MSWISDRAQCEIAKWLARAILTTITWTNIMTSLLALLHAVSVFASIYGCSFFGHHVVANQMLMMSLIERNGEEMDTINAFQFKAADCRHHNVPVKLVMLSTIFQMAYHVTVIRVNWRLFRCYDFFRPDFIKRVRIWWWLQMSVVSMTLLVTILEQMLIFNLCVKEFEEVFYVWRRSYCCEWKLLVFDIASLILVKWYARIMYFVRFMHRFYYGAP